MPTVLVIDHPLTLGEKVRLLRIAHRWRQSDLAFHAEVTPRAVSNLERDAEYHPEVIARIAEALGVELSPDDADD